MKDEYIITIGVLGLILALITYLFSKYVSVLVTALLIVSDILIIVLALLFREDIEKVIARYIYKRGYAVFEQPSRHLSQKEIETIEANDYAKELVFHNAQLKRELADTKARIKALEERTYKRLDMDVANALHEDEKDKIARFVKGANLIKLPVGEVYAISTRNSKPIGKVLGIHMNGNKVMVEILDRSGKPKFLGGRENGVYTNEMFPDDWQKLLYGARILPVNFDEYYNYTPPFYVGDTA